ncbi:MAG: hypothetical protein ACN6OP_23855 [Pseudomonadales bacterium]
MFDIDKTFGAYELYDHIYGHAAASASTGKTSARTTRRGSQNRTTRSI